MKTFTLIALVTLVAPVGWAELQKELPKHWGAPPEIQTMDYVMLPDGYGHGSSTLRNWIAANLVKDRATASGPAISPTPANAILFAEDFQKLPPGPLPDEFLVLGGDFAVKVAETNHFLELPGTPLDSFAVQFGPAEREHVSVSARIFGSAKGRRAPTFGVGLGGVSGHKLQVSPGKKALEILRDQEVKATTPYAWQPGTWTSFKLRIGKSAAGEWKVEGKAWPATEPEPIPWTVTLLDQEEPIAGRASVLGSPFAGTPIGFDDLKVERTGL